MPFKTMMVAVEPSADLIAAEVMSVLTKKLDGNVEYFGAGGEEMEKQGLTSLFPIDPFTVMGVTDALKVAPLAMKRAKELALEAARAKANVAVFVDGWAFARLCATRFKKYAPDVKLIKLVAPQVWASRPHRVHFVKDHFDGVLTILPFEPHYFTDVGIKAAFVGNPNFQAAWAKRGDGAAFRNRHGIKGEKILAVLLGSRKSEVNHQADLYGAIVDRLVAQVEGLTVVVPAASAQRDLIGKKIDNWNTQPLIVDQIEKYDALAAADAALAVSGTITTELAINQTPMAVTYRADMVTSFFAKRMVTTDYASIINIEAEREIIPEFIQEECEPAKIAATLVSLLTGPEGRAQVDACDDVLERLGVKNGDAAEKAAEYIIEWAT